tara:strand:+ start:72 stop:239 length:168 start_codon:yes stop_codon:yes gene_type:complete
MPEKAVEVADCVTEDVQKLDMLVGQEIADKVAVYVQRVEDQEQVFVVQEPHVGAV